VSGRVTSQTDPVSQEGLEGVDAESNPHALASPERLAAAREAAERVARQSYGKLVALVASRTSDVAWAEDALADAFAAALVDWPLKGVPRAPEAWLLTRSWRTPRPASRRSPTSGSA
jgi:RNA polymerase sigma-70 factor, ECF subfamily